MLSKRIIVCLYRTVNRQTVTARYCCHRNRHVSSRSRAFDNLTSGTEKPFKDEEAENRKLSYIPRTRLRIDREQINEINHTDTSAISREINHSHENKLQNTADYHSDFENYTDVSVLEEHVINHTGNESKVEGQVNPQVQGDLSLVTKSHSITTDQESYDNSVFGEDSYLVPSDYIPKRKEFQPLFHLAPYVNESLTLSSLVKLGVSLAEIEKKEGAADVIVKLDFKKDIKPVLLFLKDTGVADDDLGRVITKNPFIFNEDVSSLQIRINYLKSKKFSQESISTIVTRNSLMLSMTVERIDASLGFYQREFRLTGTEVRSTVTKCPMMITWNREEIKRNKNYMKEFLGFTASEMKKMFLTSPKVYCLDQKKLEYSFDYLHNVMGLSHKDILLWPQIFQTRLFIIQERHRYLASLGRAQYNPNKENYVFLRDLVSGSDDEFCENIAKTSVEHFNDFLKML